MDWRSITKAELTAENRPACECDLTLVATKSLQRQTHEYQGGVKILIIFFRVFLVEVLGFPTIDGEEVGTSIVRLQRLEELFESGVNAARISHDVPDTKVMRLYDSTTVDQFVSEVVLAPLVSGSFFTVSYTRLVFVAKARRPLLVRITGLRLHADHDASDGGNRTRRRQLECSKKPGFTIPMRRH